jgi:hypothetical protein
MDVNGLLMQLDTALRRAIPVRELMPQWVGVIPELGVDRRRYLLDGTVVVDRSEGP